LRSGEQPIWEYRYAIMISQVEPIADAVRETDIISILKNIRDVEKMYRNAQMISFRDMFDNRGEI